MRRMPFALLALLFLIPASFSDGPLYMTGCCPDEALGAGAAPDQVIAYASQRLDVCNPDGTARISCVVEETMHGGTGCCLPYGGLDTDGDRIEYARANPGDCGTWPYDPVITPCTVERPGGDIMPGSETPAPTRTPGPPPPDWVPIALLAALTGLGVLVIFYLLSYLVDAEHMRAMATSEMWQVFITAVMIAGFVGADAFAGEVVAPAFGEAFLPPGEESMKHTEYAVILTGEMADYQWDMLKKFTNDVVVPMGSLSALNGNCWLFGVAFSFSGCSSINVPFSSASLAARTMSVAVLALNSQLVLLKVASGFFFPVLLPIGLFLRTFHVTRGTGGFLIAFAISFYFVYPLGVLITQGFYDSVGVGEPEFPDINAVTAAESWAVETMVSTFDVPAECDPFKTYDYPETDEFEGYGYTQKQINRLLKEELVDRLLYIFMIGGVFTPALNVLIALSVIRPLARVFGTEVDVSALARIS